MTDDIEQLPEAVVGVYRRHAAAFDAKRARGFVERPWIDAFLAHVPAAGLVLDIGCAMGEPIARALAERGRRVFGVDSSPAMIALCRERLPEHEWLVADMRGLDLGRRFDGLIAWDSFFFLDPPRQREMFATFAAHARDGAPLLFTSGPEHGVRIGEFEGERLYHASLAPEEYRALLDESGFEILRHVAEDPECDFYTVWLARRRF
ncbi:MAG: class I SAM-dependent methyltransferase [Microvirga sp.]|nr:class I SAM-dependent methyltransferase [Microvirga sp.]